MQMRVYIQVHAPKQAYAKRIACYLGKIDLVAHKRSGNLTYDRAACYAWLGSVAGAQDKFTYGNSMQVCIAMHRTSYTACGVHTTHGSRAEQGAI